MGAAMGKKSFGPTSKSVINEIKIRHGSKIKEEAKHDNGEE